MRKLIAILLTIILALSLCACSGGKDPEKHATKTPASEMKLPPATGSDLTWEEIEQLLEEADAEEAQ